MFYRRGLALLDIDANPQLEGDIFSTDAKVEDSSKPNDDTGDTDEEIGTDDGASDSSDDDSDGASTNPEIAAQKKQLTDPEVAPEDRPRPEDVGLSVDAVADEDAKRLKQDELSS